ncbi:MAG: maleylpyruvate isomerase family mycothiol-dependent enzyme [Acidimicrobiales bacterium]
MAEHPGGDAGGREAGKERLVELLGREWGTISSLAASLPEAAWSRPALPGWDVHDVLAHLVGGERMLAGAPAPPDDLGRAEHVRNPMARLNEAWIVALRPLSPAELLAEFQAVTAERLDALDAMSVEEFDAPSWTPVGDGTYGRFIEIRLFDAWMHEQDIRHAAGVPGNEDGPAAELAVDEVAGALGYIVGKLGGAPDGSTVCIELNGPVHRRLCVVVDGRATVVPSLEAEPTVNLVLSSSLFLRLAGGRVDPESSLGGVELHGDAALGRRLATHLAYTI